jgi:threonine/homoserine/homoserine lactone efflux protein
MWLAFGVTAQRFLRTEHARRTFDVAMAVLLAGSVVLIAL